VGYVLSKRTDVGLQVLYDKSTGGQAGIVPQTPSTSGNQTVAFVSIRHKF
jgi:predicted porin